MLLNLLQVGEQPEVVGDQPCIRHGRLKHDVLVGVLLNKLIDQAVLKYNQWDLMVNVHGAQAMDVFNLN